jgi:hypothetical protein
MTPREFEQTYRGYLAREDRAWFMSAWTVAHLMAPHIKGGKPPKIEKLLGPHWPYAKAREGR